MVGGFTTNHDISEGTEEGMDLRLRHTWEEEDSALLMSRGEPLDGDEKGAAGL